MVTAPGSSSRLGAGDRGGGADSPPPFWQGLNSLFKRLCCRPLPLDDQNTQLGGAPCLGPRRGMTLWRATGGLLGFDALASLQSRSHMRPDHPIDLVRSACGSADSSHLQHPCWQSGPSVGPEHSLGSLQCSLGQHVRLVSRGCAAHDLSSSRAFRGDEPRGGAASRTSAAARPRGSGGVLSEATARSWRFPARLVAASAAVPPCRSI